MNAHALRAERALAVYFAAGNWGDVTVPTALASLDLGQESVQDENVRNNLPPFPYIIVRATSSESIHPLTQTQTMTLSIDLHLSADDVNPSAAMAAVGQLDSLIMPLFDTDGAAALNAASDDENGPFTAQYVFPGDLGGSSVEGRARVFNRIITIIGSATT